MTHPVPLTPPGSFRAEDVTLLLKDVTGEVEERDTALREREIQAGRHYSEDLPIERPPSREYMEAFNYLMERQLGEVALYTGILARRILKVQPEPVLVSLVRAGVPCGVLLRRYCKAVLGRDIPHYGLSIIRGKGFDENAVSWLLERYEAGRLVFVDGWTGKGMITRELSEACTRYNDIHSTALRPTLAVLADPAYSTTLYATREDFINPSCCLNSTVCGLISRTVHNDKLIGAESFHGVRVYREFKDIDQTARYLDGVCRFFEQLRGKTESGLESFPEHEPPPDWRGMEAVRRIGMAFGIEDINRIKPGIGETTRVLLRRVPDRVLLRDVTHPGLGHILLLAREKGVQVEEYPDMPYLCCGLIADKREG